ncbi:hypothetical protein IWX49DRAFT_415381, partial [Phyllosticta citricarpa]
SFASISTNNHNHNHNHHNERQRLLQLGRLRGRKGRHHLLRGELGLLGRPRLGLAQHQRAGHRCRCRCCSRQQGARLGQAAAPGTVAQPVVLLEHRLGQEPGLGVARQRHAGLLALRPWLRHHARLSVFPSSTQSSTCCCCCCRCHVSFMNEEQR